MRMASDESMDGQPASPTSPGGMDSSDGIHPNSKANFSLLSPLSRHNNGVHKNHSIVSVSPKVPSSVMSGIGGGSKKLTIKNFKGKIILIRLFFIKHDFFRKAIAPRFCGKDVVDITRSCRSDPTAAASGNDVRGTVSVGRKSMFEEAFGVALRKIEALLRKAHSKPIADFAGSIDDWPRRRPWSFPESHERLLAIALRTNGECAVFACFFIKRLVF